MRFTRLAIPLAALALLVAGWALLRDRPGLEAEYFALSAPWEGRPVHRGVGVPRLASAAEAPLVTDSVFSIRWSG